MNEITQDSLLKLIITNAYLVYDSCLVGYPCPKVAERYEFLKNLKPGQLVMEFSCQKKWESDPLNSIGRLICRRNEEVEDWEEDEPAPFELYTYLELFDGSLARWYNAAFIVVSEDPYELWSRKPPIKVFDYTVEEMNQQWANEAMVRHNLAEYPAVARVERGK